MKFVVIAAAAALCASQVAAKPTFIPLIPGSTNVKGVDSIGHINPKGGGAPNPFGSDFAAAETTWTVELCYKDSDEDGQFNGAELGDPCCEWVKDKNEKLAYTTATAPGDKTSKQDPTIWASVKCADGSSPEAKAKAFAAGGAAGGAGSKADAPVMVGGNSTTAAPDAKTPASESKAPAATTPAPTKASSAAPLAAAASAVTVAVAALFA